MTREVAAGKAEGLDGRPIGPRPESFTGLVLSIHGVTTGIDSERFAYRNLLDTNALRQYLALNPRCVPIGEALAGRGTALTIDDATRAGADAALLARQLGHDVTLFVNPGQVESGAPYHFVLLNTLLDTLDGKPREFAGQKWSTTTIRQRQALRSSIKESLRAIPVEGQRLAFVTNLAARWGVTDLEVPLHFMTLTRAELRSLLDAGVDLQNHGWSHSHHANLTPTESAREVREGREWLQRELGTDAPWFAVPFGDSLPHRIAVDCEAWLTISQAWKTGWLGPSVFNRKELTLTAPATRESLAAWSLRGLSDRLSGLLRP